MIKYLKIFILILLSCELFSQEDIFKQYTVADGLLTNHVYGCIKDVDGYMWFYTEKGVSKFNGKTFKHFTTDEGLPTNDVWNLTEDNRGRIWVHSNANKLAYILNDKVHILKLSRTESFSIFQIESIGDTVLFVNNRNRSLIIFVNDTLKTIAKFKFGSARNDFLNRIKEDDSSNLKILVDETYNERNVHTNSGNSFKINGSLYNELLLKKGVSCFTFDEGRKFVATFEKGEDLIVDFKTCFGKVPDRIRYYKFRDQIQVSSSLGIIRIFDNNEIEVYRFSDFFEGLNVSRTFIDDIGNIWINTLNEGFYQIANDLVNIEKYSYSSRDFQPANNIIKDSSLYLFDILGNMVLYNIKQNGDLELKDQRKLLERISEVSLFNNEILVESMYLVDDNWNLTKRIDSTVLKYLSSDIFLKNVGGQNMKNTKIKYSTKYYQEQGDFQFILCGYNPTIFNALDNSFYPSVNRNVSFYDFMKSGDHISASLNSIVVFKKEKLKYDDPILFDYKITGLAVYENTAYIGLENGDLYSYDSSGLKKIDKLSLGSIKDMQFDSTGQLIILTDQRLYKYFQDELILLFNHDRVKREEFDQLALYKDNIYLISKNSIYNISSDYQLSKLSDQIRIDHVKVNGVLYNIETLNELTYDMNNLEIQSAFLDYTTQGNFETEWKLTNDEDSLLTKGSIFQINNLSPGSYNLELKVKANEEYTSSKIFPINIEKPIWLRTWFLILLSCLALSVMYLLYRYLINRNNKKKQAEFLLQKQFSELELKALRSQLNPHFMFNAMGSIQSLIQSDRKSDADQYLAKFAALLRSFLDSSRKRFISLQQELDIISDYVDIEKLRFGNVQFSIENKTTFSLSEIQVPALILQPSVENIFQHAFDSIDSNNAISIIINEKAESFDIFIDDNGVGIEERTQNGKKSVSTKSLGINLIKERLEVIKSIENGDYSMQILDKSDIGENGTRIIFEIPKDVK